MAKIQTFKDAQKFVKNFANKNGWRDYPNIDKFDHVHEELIEMSRMLRYKTEAEMLDTIKTNKDEFEDGIGDTIFALTRLANQLGIDMEKSLNLVLKRIALKYKGKKTEAK